MKKLRIFVASPSDTAAERAKVETVAELLKPLADNLEIVLDVADWSDVVPAMGRPEQVILDQLKPNSWDVFIGILWHRFGTAPGDKDPQTHEDYQAGTEEEFKTAYRLWQQYQKPRIIVYRCTRNVPLDALDPDQFKRVKEFFAQFEALKGEHPGLYQSFSTTDSFEKLLVDNLQRLLLDYGEEIKGKPVAPEVVQEFAPKVPDNLPRRTPFFGRYSEMETVLRALSPEDRTWGVLLDGIGGIGKTALAVEAAYHTKEKGLFDSFVFVSAKQDFLDPSGIRQVTPVARTVDEFLNETARVLGHTRIAKLEGNDKRRALLDALRSTRALLIYDNLETLAKQEQEALADFLRQLPPGCKAIITSRRRGGEGSVWLRLERLEWEAARRIIETEVARDPQLAKKLLRAGEARWQELYDSTAGSPLALVHTLGLIRVRATLNFDRALEMLRGNRDGDLQRFVFQEARKELTTNDQLALGALSFFAPSATFEAWQGVTEISRNAMETTVDRLSALSLVDMQTGEERYSLHPLTRNFVRDELLVDLKVAHDRGKRFAEYWVAYSQQYGAENYKTFALIEAEWTNLDAAAEWLWVTAAVQDGNIGDTATGQILNDLAAALCSAVGPLFFVGRWDESVRLGARAYEVMRKLNQWSKAGWCAYQVTWIHFNRGNDEEARPWVDRFVEAWTRGGSKLEQAIGLRMRGQLAQQRKDYDDAEQLYQESLAIFRDSQDDLRVGLVLESLGILEAGRGENDAAKRYGEEALSTYERGNHTDLIPAVLLQLGDIAFDGESWKEARERCEKALSLLGEIGRQDLIAAAKERLARVNDAEGRPDLALLLAQEALGIQEQLQDSSLRGTQELVERLKKKVADSKSATEPRANED